MVPTLKKTLTLAAVACAIALGSSFAPMVSAPAEAKKIIIFKKHGHLHGLRYFGAPLLVGGAYYYGYSGCYWLKVRAIETGSAYWWSRWHACRGD